MNMSCAPEIGIGIVAEYNPFHNGHALHIEHIRRNFGAGAPVIVVLSSAFTQRGEPAVADKWTRAQMALANGADLVLELPFVYACNAAQEFARGAVDILAATGLVTHLSFGMENPFDPQNATSGIDTILNILIQEPPSFKLNLAKNLARGQSWPKALAGALDRELPGSGAFISTPNNALGLAYLLHIRRKGYGMVPFPIQREGAGYHDGKRGPLASATGIRAAMAAGDASWLHEAVPVSSLALLRTARECGRLCSGADALWNLLRGLLSRSTAEELRICAGMDEGLENLFLKHYADAKSWEDFFGRCVCARYTRSRLRRQAIRLLVGLDRWTALALSRRSPPYIRVLGYNARGRDLLRVARKTTSVPIVSRLGAAKGPIAEAAADLEFRASRLWELTLPHPDLKYEEKQKPVSV